MAKIEMIDGKLSVPNNPEIPYINGDGVGIAYVSQFFTLKIGDIIFTGTPAGVASVRPNDILEGFLEGQQLFRIQVK